MLRTILNILEISWENKCEVFFKTKPPSFQEEPVLRLLLLLKSLTYCYYHHHYYYYCYYHYHYDHRHYHQHFAKSINYILRYSLCTTIFLYLVCIIDFKQ